MRAGKWSAGWALAVLWVTMAVVPWLMPLQPERAHRLQRRSVEARLVALGFTIDQARVSVAKLSEAQLVELASGLGARSPFFVVLTFVSLLAGTVAMGLVVWVL